MKEILLINPTQKGVKKMAKARNATKSTKKRTYKKNPSSPPKRRRSATRRTAGRLFAGLNIKQAVSGIFAGWIGMMAAKFAAKRFGGGGSEIDPASWSWRTYMQAVAGAILAGAGINMIRPGMGQRVLEGGMLLVGYKLLQNELISKNTTATSWLGQDDGTDILDGYSGYGQEELILDGYGNPYLLGQGSAIPLDERHRGVPVDDDLPEIQVGGYGEQLVPVGPLGDSLVPVGPLGYYGDERSDTLAQYKRAWS